MDSASEKCDSATGHALAMELELSDQFGIPSTPFQTSHPDNRRNNSQFMSPKMLVKLARWD
jgi:hypothetical protein